MLQMKVRMLLEISGYETLTEYMNDGNTLSFGGYCFRIPIHGEEIDVNFDFPGTMVDILGINELCILAGCGERYDNYAANARLEKTYDAEYASLGIKRSELTAKVLASVTKILAFNIECAKPIQTLRLLSVDFEEDGVKHPVPRKVLKQYRPRFLNTTSYEQEILADERNSQAYTWDELFDEAVDKGFGSPELQAKDEARWQVRCFILELEEDDIDVAECPEDEVEKYCNMYDIRFDRNGNILETSISTDDKTRMLDAMEVAGYYHDVYSSSPGNIRFQTEYDNAIYFENWVEVKDWLLGVVFDDPVVARMVEKIMNK